MRIANIRGGAHDGVWRCEADIRWESASRSARTVYFELPADDVSGLTPTPEPFLLAAAVPATAAGEPAIEVDAPICPQTKANITYGLKMLRVWNPRGFAQRALPEIKAPVRREPLSTIGVRTGAGFYSGGVDSTYLAMRNAAEFPYGHIGRLTHLIAVYGFDIGGQVARGDERQVFGEFLSMARPATDTLRMKLLPVYTNLRHLDDRPGYWGQLFSGFALAAVAHLLRARFSPIYLAGTGEPMIATAEEPFGVHPLILPMLSTHELSLIMPYVDVSRLERVAQIADDERALRGLRVCFRSSLGEQNCGRCEKCIRTHLELFAATGRMYPDRFNAPVTVESVQRIVIDSAVAASFYGDLLPLLDRRRRSDLSTAVRDRVRAFLRYRRWAEERGFKGAVKRMDRRYLGGILTRLAGQPRDL